MNAKAPRSPSEVINHESRRWPIPSRPGLAGSCRRALCHGSPSPSTPGVRTTGYLSDTSGAAATPTGQDTPVPPMPQYARVLVEVLMVVTLTSVQHKNSALHSGSWHEHSDNRHG